MTNYTIDKIYKNEYMEVANLIAQAIPNALISKLGNRFGAAYYRKIVEQEYSCSYAVRDKSGNIAGVIIGTTNYPKASSIAFRGQLVKLIIIANFRLFRWSVISRMIKRVIARAGGVQQDYTIRPDAELVAIMVCPKARGTGVAQKLVEEMEKFMASRGYKGPYAIRTERTNERANSFYEKIGAKFVKTVQYYGIEINEWHRSI